MSKQTEKEYRVQVAQKAKQLKGVARYDFKATPKLKRRPGDFDPDNFKEYDIIFPAFKPIGKAVTLLALCFFNFVLPAQESVTLMNISTKYVEFTWKGDTLSNSEFHPFFLALDYAETNAGRMASELTNALLMRPTAVSEISGDMERTLFGVTFDHYACFFHLREQRARIIGK